MKIRELQTLTGTDAWPPPWGGLYEGGAYSQEAMRAHPGPSSAQTTTFWWVSSMPGERTADTCGGRCRPPWKPLSWP